jgi:hypothetical protein
MEKLASMEVLASSDERKSSVFRARLQPSSFDVVDAGSRTFSAFEPAPGMAVKYSRRLQLVHQKEWLKVMTMSEDTRQERKLCFSPPESATKVWKPPGLRESMEL